MYWPPPPLPSPANRYVWEGAWRAALELLRIQSSPLCSGCSSEHRRGGTRTRQANSPSQPVIERSLGWALVRARCLVRRQAKELDEICGGGSVRVGGEARGKAKKASVVGMVLGSQPQPTTVRHRLLRRQLGGELAQRLGQLRCNAAFGVGDGNGVVGIHPLILLVIVGGYDDGKK